MIFKSIQTLVFAWLMTFSLEPSQHRGQVKLGGLPVPGAVVTAVQNDKKVVAVTDDDGTYTFPDLQDGSWSIQVEMLGFAPVKKDVTVAADAPAGEWELKILPVSEIGAITSVARAAEPPTAAPAATPARPAAAPARSAAPQLAAPAPSDAAANDASQAADGLLINGSVNNGAASPFAQAAAFGNARRTRAAYQGGVVLLLDSSKLDAQSFSVTGQPTPKPDFTHVLGGLTFGSIGPLRIPHLIRNGPSFVFNYQRTQNRTATTQSALMPTLAERNGDLSGHAVYDPRTGELFPGNQIPQDRISPQARALLALFPLPNFTSSRFNYQVPLVSAMHQDNFRLNLNKSLNTRNQMAGDFSLSRTANDNPSVFGLLDKSNVLGLSSFANWVHRIGQRSSVTTRYQFSRQNSRVTPYFANQVNVSGQAGISGNNQEPLNWGPPALIFSSGFAQLSTAQNSLNRNQTHALTFTGLWNRSSHSIQYGGDFRRQQFNVVAQQDARGAFGFTGAATACSRAEPAPQQPPTPSVCPDASTGFDFADFLLGTPTTASIAFGNADKYFRQSVMDGFFSDDWRVRSGLTLNLGLRWEFESPLTEKYGRTVNLDIAPGFTSAVAVVGSKLQSDRKGLQPRVSLAWRPLPASSLVVRAGYGIYRNTSVYQPIVTRLAQQAPLSKSLSVSNNRTNPFTIQNGFNATAASTPNTFAIDPNFRIGSAHNWNVVVQRDLPASLMMVATYLGTKGTGLMQEFLPNTYPTGAVNPCPSCPSGFEYLTSNGTSSRQSGQFQLRRRLHNGFTANVQYTIAKATDDAGFSAANPLIAQNWLDLKAERAPSSFDQRHQVASQIQYTTGMGVRGGTLLGGWRGSLFKEWTIVSTITAGSGLPLTPVYSAAPVKGTGVIGSIRPDYNGGPVLDRSSYSAPAPGKWGNAGRNSITGPSQFSMNASLSRTVRLNDRINADLRMDATNILNHVTYPNWNTNISSVQFGLPNTANAMRKIQSSLRIRF